MASVNSTTSANRLTGLATGLDVDSMVKTQMAAYEKKVNSVIQQKDVVGIKQKLYRDVLSDTRGFYNKYLDPLSKDSLVLSSAYQNVKFTSSNDSLVTAKGNSTAKNENYSVEVTQLAKKASLSIDTSPSSNKIDFGGAGVEFEVSKDATKTDKENVQKTIENLKEAIEKKKTELKSGTSTDKEAQLKALNVDVRYSEFDNKIIVEAKEFGQGTLKSGSLSGDDVPAEGIITKNGVSKNFSELNGGKDLYSNSLTVDGVSFTFYNVTGGTLDKSTNTVTGGKPITITGKVDVTDTKKKIVNFVNEYNTLIEKLNKTINTKHDRDYVPLTSAQKEEMSDKEIELWEGKVETGQLYKDSDITRIVNSMKQTMRTVMSDSGFNLKDMGITPVEDYSGNKNGTFTIDEDKLTKALENNMDDVLNLFTSNPKTTTDINGTTNKGILYQLKDTLYSEVMKSDSILSKKVGIEGTSTFTNNTLTKNISDYETKIKKMQKDLATREQRLYSKYATLETIMNKYNSQQSYLTSYLGS